MKSHRLAVWAIIGFGHALMISASHGATVQVNSLLDNTPPGDGLVTLREAIVAANADLETDLGDLPSGADTLDLTQLSGVITLSEALPAITTSMTILGAPNQVLTIDGDETYRIFQVEAGTVAIRDLVLANAYHCQTRGAAIQNTTTLTVTNCAFISNRAPSGGAIGNEETGTLNITNCLFEGNYATPEIFENALITDSYRGNFGAAIVNLGEVTVKDTDFHNNHAKDGIVTNFGIARMARCAFTGHGGQSSVQIDLDGPVISSLDPGFHPAPALELTECLFENNLALSVYTTTPGSDVHRCAFINNTAPHYAGAFETAADNVTVTNCTFKGNTATQRFLGDLENRGGGAIFHGDGNLTVYHCTIVDNQSYLGGGILSSHLVNESAPFALDLQNSIVLGNAEQDVIFFGGLNGPHHTATNLIGTAHHGDHPDSIDAFLEEANVDDVVSRTLETAPNGMPYLPLAACSPALDAGNAAILVSPPFDATPGITDITGNPRISGAQPDLGSYESSLSDCVPQTPPADIEDVPGALQQSSGLLVSSLRDPGLPGDGLVTLREALNAILNDTTTDLGQSGASTSTIDLRFLSGTLDVHTGFPYIAQDITFLGPEDNSLVIASGDHPIDSFLFLATDGLGATITLEHLRFEGITTMDPLLNASGGNHVYILENCSFADIGPAAVLHAAEVRATNVTWAGCANRPFNCDRATITSCRIEGNGAAGNVYVSATVEDSLFVDNRTTHGAGALEVTGGEIDRCLFVGNVGGAGGALRLSGSVEVRNTTLAQNRALGERDDRGDKIWGGGAIFVDSVPSGNRVRFTNCTVAQNMSGHHGGGIEYASQSDGQVIVRNCIIAGNAARLTGQDVKGNFIGMRSNVIGRTEGAAGFGEGDRTGFRLAEIVVPVLTDPSSATGGYVVFPCSPAYDFGQQYPVISGDQRGEPRPSGCAFDAGAYELQVQSCQTVDPETCVPLPGDDPTFEGEFIDFENPEAEPVQQCSYSGVADPSLLEELDLLAEHGPTLENIAIDLLAALDSGSVYLGLPTLDTDRDGRIDQSEIEDALAADDSLDILHEALEYFALLDRNDDGYLHTSELQRFNLLLLTRDRPIHSADVNANHRLELSELLRVIQIYTSGFYGCPFNPADTEDGYLPGSDVMGPFTGQDGSWWCWLHSSDYDDPAPSISMSELLRTIQHYNAGQVIWYLEAGCDQGEDNFCNPAFFYEGEGAAE